MIFFQIFPNPLNLLWKLQHPETFLSQKYIWLVLISDNFIMISQHVLELLGSKVCSKMGKLVSRCNFLHFWPPEKFIQIRKKNFEIKFSENIPWSIHILPTPIVLINCTSCFKGILKMLQITFCSPIQRKKSLKYA